MTKRKKMKKVKCSHCGDSIIKADLLVCPVCRRQGCCTKSGGCMPAGRQCMCPECEEAEITEEPLNL